LQVDGGVFTYTARGGVPLVFPSKKEKKESKP